eukprot:g8625.t1
MTISTRRSQDNFSSKSRQKNPKEPVQSTPFREKVFEKCKAIPLGRVSTYGQLAKSLETSPRAVGQALRCNNRKDVPCHRVVRSDRSIGGFRGNDAIDSIAVKDKISKLLQEGVQFESFGIVSTESMYLDL